MEPISLILAGLAAGTSKGVGEAAATAVKDAYSALRGALGARLSKPAAHEAVEEYVADPAAGSLVVEAYLRQAGADRDEAIVQAAARVLRHSDPTGAAAGKYVVNLDGAQGVQVGDGNTQTNTFTGRS